MDECNDIGFRRTAAAAAVVAVAVVVMVVVVANQSHRIMIEARWRMECQFGMLSVACSVWHAQCGMLSVAMLASSLCNDAGIQAPLCEREDNEHLETKKNGQKEQAYAYSCAAAFNNSMLFFGVFISRAASPAFSYALPAW